jgi:hypothetical protein
VKVVITDGGSGVGGVIAGLALLGLGAWAISTFPLTCLGLGGLALAGKLYETAVSR